MAELLALAFILIFFGGISAVFTFIASSLVWCWLWDRGMFVYWEKPPMENEQ